MPLLLLMIWEFEFTRNIIVRGAGFTDMMGHFGAFLLYSAAVWCIFSLVFYRARQQAVARAVKGDVVHG